MPKAYRCVQGERGDLNFAYFERTYFMDDPLTFSLSPVISMHFILLELTLGQFTDNLDIYEVLK